MFAGRRCLAAGFAAASCARLVRARAAHDRAFGCSCIGTVKGKIVALIRHEGAVEEDCRIADIVIAPFTIGQRCRAARVIVDRRVLRTQGAHALYIEGLSIRTETVAASRGHRPWVPIRTIVKATPRAQPEPFADDGGADEATRASTAIQKSDGRTA